MPPSLAISARFRPRLPNHPLARITAAFCCMVAPHPHRPPCLIGITPAIQLRGASPTTHAPNGRNISVAFRGMVAIGVARSRAAYCGVVAIGPARPGAIRRGVLWHACYLLNLYRNWRHARTSHPARTRDHPRNSIAGRVPTNPLAPPAKYCWGIPRHSVACLVKRGAIPRGILWHGCYHRTPRHLWHSCPRPYPGHLWPVPAPRGPWRRWTGTSLARSPPNHPTPARVRML
jgi:hypothetical protein